jgi:hypothetical protein
MSGLSEWSSCRFATNRIYCSSLPYVVSASMMQSHRRDAAMVECIALVPSIRPPLEL